MQPVPNHFNIQTSVPLTSPAATNNQPSPNFPKMILPYAFRSKKVPQLQLKPGTGPSVTESWTKAVIFRKSALFIPNKEKYLCRWKPLFCWGFCRISGLSLCPNALFYPSLFLVKLQTQSSFVFTTRRTLWFLPFLNLLLENDFRFYVLVVFKVGSDHFSTKSII